MPRVLYEFLQNLLNGLPHLQQLWPSHFARPYMGLMAILAWPLMIWWSRLQPRIKYPGIRLHVDSPSGIKKWLQCLLLIHCKDAVRPSLLAQTNVIAMAIAFLSLVAILAQPQVREPKVTETKDCLAALLVKDVSGSMKEELKDPDLIALAKTEAAKMKEKSPCKIDATIAGELLWIQNRLGNKKPTELGSGKNDLIGLSAFGNTYYRIATFTDEADLLTAELRIVRFELNEGTNFEGPTKDSPLVGCIQGPIDQFKEMKVLLRRHGTDLPETLVAVISTDGEATISPARMKELLKEIDKLEMYYYILGVGDSWTKTPPNPATKDIRDFIDAVNKQGEAREAKKHRENPLYKPSGIPHGRIFPIARESEMQAGYAYIESLHRSPITTVREQGYREETRLFAWICLVSWLSSVAISALMARRI